MKELEVELEQLRLLVVAVVGREQVGGASGFDGGTVDDKVGEDDERDARESSPQPGRRLRVGKVTGRRETGKYSFSQRVINEWNKLPNDCVNASSVNMFKNRIDRYLIRAGYT